MPCYLFLISLEPVSNLETIQNGPYFLFHPGLALPFGFDDVDQASRSFLDFAVDQNKIVLRVVLNFLRRSPQPALNHFFAILGPRAKPLLQNVPRRRQYKNADGLRDGYLQLSRTLDINVEYQVFALARGRFKRLTVGSVVIAENLSIF